jgi:hypothetical protein
MRLVDLSTRIQQSPEGTPEFLRTEIAYADHTAGADHIEQLFGLGREALRDGEGWAVEEFTRFGTHNSTHVDAPWHYNSTIAGEPAQTIDELPLEWFHAPGVVLDFATREDGEAIDVADMQGALERIGHTLAPLDIVLVRTDRDAFYAELDYMARGPGVTADATRWLFEQASASWASTPGGGTAHCMCRPRRPTSAGRPASSGPPTRPTCPTRRSSAWPTSPRCRARGSA